ADSGPTARAEDAEHFTEELVAVGLVDEVENAVGEDDVDGAAGDHRQVLNPPLVERHVVPADATGDLPLILAGQCQHVLVHVDADDPPLRADNLRSDVTDFASAAAEIQHCLPFPDKT